MKHSDHQTCTWNNEELTLQHLNGKSDELHEDLVTTISESFQEVFSNPPYGQFLFYPSEGTCITPQQALSSQEAYIDLETLDTLDLKAYPRHPQTQETAERWIDPEVTQKSFSNKLSKGFASILWNTKKELIGVSLGYLAPLKEVFAEEEWQNPYRYSTRAEAKDFRSFETFMKGIQGTASQLFPDEDVSADSEVFCHNCLFIAPDYQRRGLGYQLEMAFLSQLPDHVLALPMLCEALLGSRIKDRATKYGQAITVPGILSSSDDPEQRDLMVTSAQKALDGVRQYLHEAQLPSF